MAEVAKLKKQSNAFKSHLSRSITTLKDELGKDEKERSVELMVQLIQQVEIKHDKWEKAMMNIQDKDNDADIDKSMNEIDSILDSVIQLKVKTNNIIKQQTKDVIKVEEPPSAPPGKSKVKDRMNLPKIQMKKFNGVDIEMFQEWFQMFDATINKSTLSTVEKFIYLKMSLDEGSEAAKLIDGYQVTEQNYDTALKDLYEAYGDPEIVINYHVSKLLSLPTQSGPQSLKDLYNSVTTHVRSLDALGITAEQYSVFLVPIVKSKLADDLRKEITRKKIKDITELLTELKEEVEVESSSHQVKVAFGTDVKTEPRPPQPNPRWSNQSTHQNYQSHPPVNTAQVLTTVSRGKYCIFCPGTQSHWVDECTKGKNMSPMQVKEIAIRENACLLCLKKGHRYRYCMSRGKIKCTKCNSFQHNPLLHEDNRKNTHVTVTSNQETSNQQSESTTENEGKTNSPEISQETVNKGSEVADDVEVKGATTLQARLGKEATIMPIIKVRIIGNNDKKLEVNAMLDQCSDQTFIRSDVIKALKLDGPTVPIEVRGITGMSDGRKNRKMINTSLYNKDFSQEVKVSLIEMPLICKPIKRPAVPTQVLNNRNLRNINLADNYQNEEEKEIHILIGLDYYYSCITGKIKRAKDQPVAIETIFGWMLVSDSLNQDLQQETCSTTMCTMFISEEAEKGINDDLKKFWELDEEIISKPINTENEAAIKKFHESVSYDKQKKQYEVGLPYVDSKDIYSNYRKAEIILKSQLKRFEKNPVLKENYHHAMNEYIEQGFAELVPDDEIYSSDPSVYYMPHSAVIKDENTTTKTRIVFNASSSAKNQKSLNDKLLKGPKRQPSISEILIRWRMKPVALVADIRKMYSMILVRQEDRNALRFLWLNGDDKIVHYRHKVLPFGVRSAPYLAIETVQSHIMKFSEEYPDVTESLIDSTYVDDYCTSEENADTAIDTITASDHIMQEAGMELRKWKSNDPVVMNHLKTLNASTISDDEERKVLGAWWNAESDEFYYNVSPKIYKSTLRITKRMIVASVPTLHDPIGFIAPVILKGKAMIQKLWAAGVEWDENLVDTDIANEWLEWRDELEQLKDVKLNRKYTPSEATIKEQQVHVFCDASEKGYAAVAYMRSEADNGTTYTEFITSKTKVAPLKFVTLPRIELLAALIASRLSVKIKEALKDQHIKFYHWSDSAITLQWIKNTDMRWKTFVESRVDEIRDHTDPRSWRHVPGVLNPADIASRGAFVRDVKDSTLWRGGPSWLMKSKEQWPQGVNVLTVTNHEAMKEKRSKQLTCLVADTSVNEPVISADQYSSFNTLIRKTAYIMRFPRNCRLKKLNKPMNVKGLTAEERSDAQKYWLQIVQQEYYPEEVNKLKVKEQVKQDSKIVQLSPYLDETTGLIRMKGRIQNANLTESEKHPIILPHQSPVVKLLVEYIHLKQMHAGINQTLVAVRDEFWVTCARSLVRSIVKSCLICRMHMPTRLTAPLPPLPEDRVTETTPFNIIGVDFTGPVYVSETKQTLKHTKKRPVKLVKTKTTSKAYIALTTCAVTRSVHLELVPDLSTDSFIRAFRRFTSRRGQCSVIYSDNAKTYKSAEKGISQCYEILNSAPFKEYLAEKSIKWKYICPLSPWWGGFWERLMKTIKLPLKKVLGKSFLSYDELATVLTEVEAMVNSRPLLPVTDDPDNINYLTPANFLIGRPTINLPVRPLKHTEVNPNATRKELNQMLQYQEAKLTKIWKMWREEYLRSLGIGANRKERLPIQEGDLVMVAGGQQPRCTWKVGRVEQLLEGRDDKIRSAIVRTEGKLRTRPIQLMSKLEVSA